MKLVVTDGEYSAEANTWEMVHSMIMSSVMNVIDPKLHASVANVDSTQKMWENI